MRDTQRQKHRQREKQAPCGKPDVGLDPRTPESRPEPKAGAQPLSHPGVSIWSFQSRSSTCSVLRNFLVKCPFSFWTSCYPEIGLLVRGLLVSGFYSVFISATYLRFNFSGALSFFSECSFSCLYFILVSELCVCYLSEEITLF